MRFLDQFTTILLDMNSTFMFGEDRFGDGEDFFATYRQLGGRRLDHVTVNAAITRCYQGMSRDYEDPAKTDDFPSLAEGLRKYAGVSDEDLPMLESVFSHHEMGHIPLAYADCLKRLSQSHQLAVVSNIWASKAPWLMEFERAGVSGIWHSLVFSSDSRSIKPSLRLFREATAACGVSQSNMVFVGDSLRVDVEPANRFGMATVWINPVAKTHSLADRTVSSLLELETLA